MNHAERVRVCDDGPLVTRLGFGASAIGGLFTPVSEDEGTAVARAALDIGLRYIDTAPLYGLGASERRVGAALGEVAREDFTISTKVGRLVRRKPATFETLPEGMWHVPDELKPVFDFSRDGVRRSLVESLERLDLDAVDIALVHDPDGFVDRVITETLPALRELCDEGLVRAVGIGMADTDALEQIVRAAPVDCVLIAGRFTLLDQTAHAGLLPACARENVGVILGGVFNSGILADPASAARFDYLPAEPSLVGRACQIAAICAGHGVPLPAAALQFGFRHPAVRTVLTGVRSTVELTANVTHFNLEIPEDMWNELELAGLIPPLMALREETSR